MTTRVAILTCVGNDSDGTGPGHTSLIVGNRTHSFEALIGHTAWKSWPTKTYVGMNTHRPLVIQELRSNKVDGAKVLQYIKVTGLAGLDYLSAGVCSQQASFALSNGTAGGFDPRGFDTPWNVYAHAANRKLAASTYVIWSGSSGADAKLKSEFPTAVSKGDGILHW